MLLFYLRHQLALNFMQVMAVRKVTVIVHFTKPDSIFFPQEKHYGQNLLISLVSKSKKLASVRMIGAQMR